MLSLTQYAPDDEFIFPIKLLEKLMITLMRWNILHFLHFIDSLVKSAIPLYFVGIHTFIIHLGLINTLPTWVTFLIMKNSHNTNVNFKQTFQLERRNFKANLTGSFYSLNVNWTIFFFRSLYFGLKTLLIFVGDGGCYTDVCDVWTCHMHFKLRYKHVVYLYLWYPCLYLSRTWTEIEVFTYREVIDHS